MNYIKKRGNAFSYAFQGLKAASGEANLRLHFLAVLAVVVNGLYFGITTTEWCVLLICCGLVICLELINSAIERLCDAVIPETNPKIKFVKDVSAAAVLMAAITSVIVGVIIFKPYVMALLS